MKTRNILILAAAMLLCGTITAQNVNVVNDAGVSKAELEEVTLRIKDKVGDFVSALGDLVDPDISTGTKRSIRTTSLNLFIGKGDRYHVTQTNRYGQDSSYWHEPVQMETIQSKRNQKRSKSYMRDYLTGLIEKVTFRHVKIESADAIRVDSFQKTGDGKYQAVAYFLQHYMRYNSTDSYQVYSDYTAKKVVIYMDRIEEVMPNGQLSVRWIIRLGDISAEEIW